MAPVTPHKAQGIRKARASCQLQKKMPSPSMPWGQRSPFCPKTLYLCISTAKEKGIVNLSSSTGMGLWVVAGQLWEAGARARETPQCLKVSSQFLQSLCYLGVLGEAWKHSAPLSVFKASSFPKTLNSNMSPTRFFNSPASLPRANVSPGRRDYKP